MFIRNTLSKGYSTNSQNKFCVSNNKIYNDFTIIDVLMIRAQLLHCPNLIIRVLMWMTENVNWRSPYRKSTVSGYLARLSNVFLV